MSKQRILIKISGASLHSNDKDIFDVNKLDSLAKEIASLSQKYSIGIVIGGGNIWRGNMTKNNFFKQANADYMGMLATVMNAIALKEAFANNSTSSVILSNLNVEKITKQVTVDRINKKLDKDNILIFAGGTGHPFFTTDTGCALMATYMDAKLIVMGKDGVDGVYSDDPKKNKDAKFFSKITFDQVFKKKLKVMDLTALTLCNDHDIDILVFNMNAKNGITKVLDQRNEFKHTLVTK